MDRNRVVGEGAGVDFLARCAASPLAEGVRMLDRWLRNLLSEVRQGLENLYGDRLEGVYLFGSRARGEAQPDSDVDILIVLDDAGSLRSGVASFSRASEACEVAPLFHTASRRAYLELREAYSRFVAAFRDAAEKLKAGDRLVAFPAGSFPPALPFVR